MAQDNHDTSHLSQTHLQSGSNPNSPVMATQSTNQIYPAPTNSYQPGQQLLSGEYRSNSSGMVSNTSASMPPLHSFSTQQPPPPQAITSPHPAHANQVAQVAQMASASYYNNPSQYPAISPDAHGGNMRYPLPAAVDSRVMSGGRHKKEIKRRTKTGCLTCRKRRIKCDELHPTCRNCQKSKRDCLGYDPIFKQQGPTPIQPAPSSAAVATSTQHTANPYINQNLIQDPSYGMANLSYDAGLAGATISPGSAGAEFDYASAIDPSLEAGATAGQAKAFQPVKLSIKGLMDLHGPAPLPKTDITQVPEKLDDMKRLYFSMYGPGLDSFLETKWFSAKGMNKLLGNRDLLDLWESLLEQFKNTSSINEEQMRFASNVEARVICALGDMVKTSASEAVTAEYNAMPAPDDAMEASRRFIVFENLLAGQVAKGNSLTNPEQGGADQVRVRELEFWYALANFVCFREDDPASVRESDATLSTLRNLLDGRENRDVLYSIAVIRALTGQRVTEYHEGQIPLHLDESDPRSKLHVAKKFITNEAGGSGTTNVIRRLCELFTRQMASSSSLNVYSNVAAVQHAK